MFDYFLKGFILGFAIAAPVGPIGILCIRKTLQFGRISGLVSGLGAAAADTLYGCLAAFGLTFLSAQFLAWGSWLKLIGSFFLLFFAYRSFIAKPHPSQNHLHQTSLVKDFLSTLFLTLTNPLTFLCYFALFAAMGLATVMEQPISGAMLVTGVFIGSSCWWLILSEGIGLFRHKLSPQTMVGINRTAGIAIGLFGLWSLTTLLLHCW